MLHVALLLLALLPALPAAASEAGEFDHYVLALSWNASWCAEEGDRRGAPQCDPRHDHGWLLHGLWPQFADGSWPSHCRTDQRDPSRADSAAMADVFGSAGLAWYQWKKHGRCSGLSSRDYFRAARDAYRGVTRPPLLRKTGREIRLDADVVEEAFLEANPGLTADGLAVFCRDGRIAEVRICLDRALAPRACAPALERRACRRPARFPPMR